MKTILSTIAIACMVFSAKASDMKILNGNYTGNLSETRVTDPIDLTTIIDDILGNNRSYYMTGSLTILKAPYSDDVASTLNLSFRNSIIVANGSDYIQANPQAKRNDSNRNNEIRIYVHQDRNRPGHIDQRKVKVNWKSGSTGEIVGILSNVTVLYQDASILITGSFQKNGYTMGVNLAISKKEDLSRLLDPERNH